jgi:hypothetical protein
MRDNRFGLKIVSRWFRSRAQPRALLNALLAV